MKAGQVGTVFVDDDPVWSAVRAGRPLEGKTTEIEWALKRFASEAPPLVCGYEKKYVQIALDGETTWKALGLQLLEKLQYPLAAPRTEHEIWSRVRSQLKGQGIWLIHIDECQHMFETLGKTETGKVLNAIKTFMKHREWPVIVVLSGIPGLLSKVNMDPQLWTRMTPVVMRPLNPRSEDLDEIDAAFYGFAEVVGADIDEVRNEDTYQRMTYGHQDQYGRIFRFMVDVFASLPPGASKVTTAHLAECFAIKRGALPGNNVFLRDDYEACDVASLSADL